MNWTRLSLTARLTAALAGALLTITTALADLVGHYKVSGTNPDNGAGYSGRVAVELTGNGIVRVVWEVEGARYVGTGIGKQNFLAISYRRGNVSALALFSQADDGNWSGVWTYVDTQKFGTERWEPQ